jgi:hypothetical protein
MYKWFILALIVMIRACHSNEIRKIPLEDKQKLERFFMFLMTQTSFGYTLCGDKPCSIHTYLKLTECPPVFAVNVFLKYPNYSTLIQGWNSWSRYSDQFPSKNFVFRHVPKYNTLVLINKKATRKVIQQNLDIFQKFSKKAFTVQELLDEICCPKGKDYLINYNIALLGVLLGYGRNNALAFSQKGNIQILKIFELDKSYQLFNVIFNPGFMSIQNGTNEEENIMLIKKLQKAKRTALKEFKEKKYFENFIKIFTSDIH